MYTPLISILMPAFNAEKYIEKAIDSIKQQTYRNWELLICDDSSSDSTVSVIRNFSDSRIRFYQNELNLGYLRTVNFLLEKVNGSFITFLDADDWSHHERLEKQLEQFTNDPALGICGTWAQYYNENGTTPTLSKCPAINHDEIKLKISSMNQFCGASIMIRKEVLDTIGGYRVYFDRIGNEDYDWSSRIVERFHSKNISEYLYFVRQASNSVTRKIRSERQLISHDLVKILIRQRLDNGKDFLEQGNFDELTKIESELLLPYQNDSSLVFRKSADINWYNRNLKNYIQSSFFAVYKSPFQFINWKYFINALFRVTTATWTRSKN